ncbi:MAG: hypothetical protein OSJ74_03140 [Clostridia bacterium]|nr:hypothetical protein [Clostridia bacterium]
MFYQEVPHVDYAHQDAELAKQGVELILSQNASIESSCVLIWGNKVLVGVLPYPLYSRSQRDALVAAVKSDIGDVYGFEEILVSFDVDIIYEINKLNKISSVSDERLFDLFYSVKVRRNV